jgi:hypothetical protein
MLRIVKTFSVTGAVALLLPVEAYAGWHGGTCSIWRPWRCFGSGGHTEPNLPPTTASVPEIDASAGMLALAVLAVMLIFAWERRRRAA